MGVGGVSYLELLILCEKWAGERLVLEKVLPYGRRGQGDQFQCRLFLLVQALIYGALAGLLAVFFGFWIDCLVAFGDLFPVKLGANHCLLRHIGWEKCGHGLASRPLETCDPGFLDVLLQMFGCPGGSGALLLSGKLPLRYCTDRFALRKPCWSLPERGHVHSLLNPAWEGAGLVEMALVVFLGGWLLD